MKHIKSLSVLLFAMLIFTAACNPQQPETTIPIIATNPEVNLPTVQETRVPTETIENDLPKSFKVVDALGREIVFEKIPERIVVVGKALFMVADAIYLFPEAGQRIIAIGDTQQGAGNFIPMIDSTFKNKIIIESEAGPEQIAAAQPDCVILKSSNAEKLGTPLEILGIPVVYLDFETPEQYQRDLKTLGQLFNNPERANFLASYFENRFDQISNVIATVSEENKPKTLVIYYSDKDGTVAFNVPPLSWMQTILVDAGGGTPVWEDANPTKGWTKVTLEQIAAWNPEVIFVVSYAKPASQVVETLLTDPQWQQLEAVKNGMLYPFAKDAYSWDQPDTRWILGLTWISAILHPELFPNLDMIQEAKAFYKDLYNMDETSFQQNIEPIFRGELN